MRTCASCGTGNPEAARFCMACGHELEPATSARGVRKTVTVVFTDVTGSTTLGERLDPESLGQVMTRYFRTMSRILERHGGTVEKFIGDAVMAVFGVPQVHEDDALRAVRAAAEMRDGLSELNRELQRDLGVTIATRTGINTGEVVARDHSAAQSFVTGDAVNVAARLEQAAEPGEILIGERTYRLVREVVEAELLEPIPLKGKGQPLPVFRLVKVEAVAVPPRRLVSPMVGRDRERLLLQWAFERAAQERACHLVTVLGSAGVGKSRLVEESLGGMPGAMVLRGRCLPYGEGITFWPVVEVVRQAVGGSSAGSPADIKERVAALMEGDPDASSISDRIGQVVGVETGSAAPEEISWAVRKLLEFLARRQPLVVVFDDIHWGEPTFLDLVEHIAEWSRDSPILLLCLARPDLVDRRSGWAGGKLNASTSLLEPLTEAQCALLIENLLGEAGLADSARAAITEAAGGNPLFVEEMLSMLIDEGSLRREADRWVSVGDVTAVAVPPTIQALLVARLELLGPEERAVLEAASVEGKVFHEGTVHELLPETIRTSAREHLMTLVRKELVRPEQAEFPGDPAFRFRHILIRDAAYQGMAKETRAELHERFADWEEQRAGERVREYEEILGYHLEQAYRYRAELGPLDDHARGIGKRAGERLVAAGRRAIARGDARAAASLLDRGVSVLPDRHPARLPSVVDLGTALGLVGELRRAETILSDAIDGARSSGDRRTEWRAVIERSSIWILTDPKGRTEEARRWVAEAVPVFEELEDHQGLAAAWRLRSLADIMLARATDAADALEHAIHHARRAPGSRSVGELFGLLLTLYHLRGPVPVDEGFGRVHDTLERAGGDPRVELAALMALGALHGMRGEFDEARRLLSKARAMRQDLGFRVWADTLIERVGGLVELLAGDPPSAETLLRREYEELEQMGERTTFSTDAGYLAQAVYAQGRFDEAERFSHICEEAAASEDAVSQILWRSARGKVLARKGDRERAESLAREAVELAERTDYVWMHADALMDLAEVLGASGRPEAAVPFIGEAIGLYESKGIVPAAERARSLLATTVDESRT